MDISLRRERLASYLRKALTSFFCENPDKVGPVCVADIIISDDMRQADIFVESLDKSKVDVAKIESCNRIIKDYLKNFFKIKYLPRIHFIEK